MVQSFRATKTFKEYKGTNAIVLFVLFRETPVPKSERDEFSQKDQTSGINIFCSKIEKRYCK